MTSPPVAMEAVVAVSIAVLATIFLVSLVALIVVCGTRYCRNKDNMARQQRDAR